jgi:serine/threonine protein kinase
MNRYRVSTSLCKTLFGEVFKALDTVTGEMVALKISDLNRVKTKRTEDPVREMRFYSEVLEEKKQHANLIRVLACGKRKQTVWLVSELVDGGELFDIIKEGGAMDPSVAVKYVLQASRAVRFMHDEIEVGHLDISPENILVHRETGQVRLCDFGQVKNLSRSCVSSAPKAMYGCPEFGTSALDRASADVWSLAVVLMTCICGRPPFNMANANCRMFSAVYLQRNLAGVLVAMGIECPAHVVSLLQSVFSPLESRITLETFITGLEFFVFETGTVK